MLLISEQQKQPRNERRTTTPTSVTALSTSLNVGRYLRRIHCFPLLNSTSSDIVFRFKLTYILRFELTVMELILDFRFLDIDDFFRTVCELLYEYLICVCVCELKKFTCHEKKLLLIL